MLYIFVSNLFKNLLKIAHIDFEKNNNMTVYSVLGIVLDRLCGLVVRVSGYRYRGPGFHPRRYQIF